jgi:hypothetical protein
MHNHVTVFGGVYVDHRLLQISTRYSSKYGSNDSPRADDTSPTSPKWLRKRP